MGEYDLDLDNAYELNAKAHDILTDLKSPIPHMQDGQLWTIAKGQAISNGRLLDQIKSLQNENTELKLQHDKEREATDELCEMWQDEKKELQDKCKHADELSKELREHYVISEINYGNYKKLQAKCEHMEPVVKEALAVYFAYRMDGGKDDMTDFYRAVEEYETAEVLEEKGDLEL